MFLKTESIHGNLSGLLYRKSLKRHHQTPAPAETVKYERTTLNIEILTLVYYYFVKLKDDVVEKYV